MALSASEKGDLIARAETIGVPRNICIPFIHQVLKWIDGSGEEWTIGRLKDFKVDLLRKEAGLEPTSTWIRRSNRKGKTFGGILGALESFGSKSRTNLEKVLALVNVYTAFVAPRVTEKQARKFFLGVTADAVTISPELTEVVNLGTRLSGARPRKGKLPRPRPLLSYFASPSKRAPLPHGSVPEVEGVIDSIRYLGITAGGQRLYHDFPDLFDYVLRGLEPEKDAVQASQTIPWKRMRPLGDAGDLYVGRIGLIQEPGYKLRAVANPGRVFQRVLEPLGKYLFGLLETLPWDCTHQQSKADAAIVRALAEHRKVYSVDLSGATDYFPLDLQAIVLKNLLPDATDVDLFLRISRGRWHLPRGIPRDVLAQFNLSTFVKWTKGQPLGLYPSFAAFALTHGILLQGLLGRTWNEDFFVLGDDVVILDDSLYAKYREVLALLNCPVSEPKTLNSSSVAEFRSVVYTSDRMIPQYKWRHCSDESFLDIVANMPYLVPLLQPKQRTVVKLIAGLPKELGGLGWNPKGLPLSERLRPFMPLLVEDYVARDRVTGYTGHIRELLYSSHLSMEASSPGLSSRTDLVTALDQRARSLVQVVLGGTLVPLYEILGRNLDLVLEGNLDLPIPGVRVNRVTKLSQWSTILKTLGLLS